MLIFATQEQAERKGNCNKRFIEEIRGASSETQELRESTNEMLIASSAPFVALLCIFSVVRVPFLNLITKCKPQDTDQTVIMYI